MFENIYFIKEPIIKPISRNFSNVRLIWLFEAFVSSNKKYFFSKIFLQIFKQVIIPIPGSSPGFFLLSSQGLSLVPLLLPVLPLAWSLWL